MGFLKKNRLSPWLLALLSVIAAILYRMGGSGHYPRQARMVGVPLVTTLAVFFMGVSSPWLVLCMGLSVGAISTYWDWTMKDKSANYFLHGFVYGLACLPLIACGVHWYAILIRSIVLAITMGVWCLIWQWDIAEETGRGALTVATIPLLLL